ncbi:MAG: adenylate/guanylate cyclase domain-containing protein [Spirochaetota bacterium]
MKIRTKLLLVVLPLMIFPLALAGITSYISAKEGVTKVAREFLSYKVTEMYKYCRRQQDILIETGLAEQEVYSNLARKSAIDYAKAIRLSETGFFMGINSSGEILFPPSQEENNVSEAEFFKTMKKSSAGLINFTYRHSRRVGYYMYFKPWDWYILLSENEQAFYADANSIKRQAAYTLGITLTFAVGLILLFVKKLTDPIGNVVRTMKNIIQSNDLSRRVRVKYNDEIGHMASWFNRMVEDLELAYNQVKQYAYRSIVAKHNEERIRNIFQKYVPDEIIDQVLKTKGRELLIGKKQEVSILFSDIRSFTSISEKLSAEEIVNSLNTYFNVMVTIIIQHKGIIDKFIGDSIMAIFGAPVLHADDPQQSVLTGLQMLQALERFNREQKSSGRPIFKIGIGINTGEVVVGNIGSTQKLDYTCVGDSVNLASRLEGLTKIYGVPIIISEYTKNRITDGNIPMREIDSVRVKGKREPVKIYQPYAGASENQKQGYEMFNQAIDLYRNRRFQEALDFFTRASEVIKGDIPTSLYIDRCRELIKNPPRENWDGVFTAQKK